MFLEDYNKTMHKRFLIIAAVLGVIWFVISSIKMQEDIKVAFKPANPTIKLKDDLINDLNMSFAKKYKKLPIDIQITITKASDVYAKGKVIFKDERGEAIWFAAKVDNKWILAADGQGPMTCDTAEEYNFNKDFVPMCIMPDGELNNRKIYD